MALAFVVGPQIAISAGRLDDLQKEWQECRAVIGRLDATLVDLRKYGFGLVAGLLTANGVVGGLAGLLQKAGNPPQPIAVPAAVISALVVTNLFLICALFTVDRYHSVLQWAAVRRAQALERALSLGVTYEIVSWARHNKIWTYVALIQYGAFIVVSAALGAAVINWDSTPFTLAMPEGADVLGWAVAGSVVFILLLFVAAEVEWTRLDSAAADTAQNVTTSDYRLAPVQIKAKSTVDQRITLAANLPSADTKVLAIIKPTDQAGLSIVGCRAISQRELEITFSNQSEIDITPVTEDCKLFLYV